VTEETQDDYLTWRETAQVFAPDRKFIQAQFDLLEALLPDPDEWVQLVGTAAKLEYGLRSKQGLLVYIVTSHALYARKRGLLGWGKILCLPAVDVQRYGTGLTGIYAGYAAQTTTGRFSIAVGTVEAAEAIADALGRACDHVKLGMPLHAPGSPEARAYDSERSQQLVSQRHGSSSAG